MTCNWFFRSYHDEEHYNSVRLKEDPCDGPARPIIIKVYARFPPFLLNTAYHYNRNLYMSLNIYWCNILIIYSLWKADADLSATAHQPKAAARRSKEGTGVDNIHAGSIKMVMAGSGCENAEKVKQVIIGCLFSSPPLPTPLFFSLYTSFCQCLYLFFFFFLLFFFFFEAMSMLISWTSNYWYPYTAWRFWGVILFLLFSSQVLGQVYGDVDAAIEFLIAEQGAEEYPVQTDSLPDQVDTSYGNVRSVLFALPG